MTTTTTPPPLRVSGWKLSPRGDTTIIVATNRGELTTTVAVIFETEEARNAALLEIRDTYHRDMDDVFSTFAQFHPQPRIQLLTR